MNGCLECSGTFKRTRPRCLCTACHTHRTTPTRGLCVYCCCQLNPDQIRSTVWLEPLLNTPHALVQPFLCLACFRERSGQNRCTCCVNSPCDLSCCNHKCCNATKILFRDPRLYFGYPRKLQGNREPDLVGWASRGDSELILSKSGSLKNFSIDPKGFSKNSSRRFAAVEIEVLNYKDAKELNETLATWLCGVVHDGSIVRNHLGLREGQDPPDMEARRYKSFEINTSPACGDTLITELLAITKALKLAKAEVSLSCGIHVHVDCRDFGYQELQKLIKVYWCIEDALFAAVHWSRHNNEFCTPCAQTFYDHFIMGVKPDTKSLKSSLIKGIYGADSLNAGYAAQYGKPPFHDTRADHYGRNAGLFGRRNPFRYSALNLHSYFLRGTVESRVHHGSIDLEEIYGWAKLLIDLFDAVNKTPATQLDEMIRVKKLEALEVLELIDAKSFKRTDLQPFEVANGVVVLRSLLPDESFQYFLKKIYTACIEPTVSTMKVLPCQLEQAE